MDCCDACPLTPSCEEERDFRDEIAPPQVLCLREAGQ
jgi:hypothetical protein